MFNITYRALAVIRRVTAHPALAETSGLRISLNTAPDANAPLGVRAVAAPAAEDREVVRDGGRLFLAPGVPDRLEGAHLDARTDDAGRVEFFLRASA